MRKLAPGSTELVYDAYNALSIGFAASEELRDCFVHVAVYPKHVNIGFNYGAQLEDPDGLLLGEGKRIRHVRVTDESLVDPRVAKLVRQAAKNAGLDRRGERRMIVKAIYANQRARKPRKR
jgi:hypothetical protein